MSLCHRAREAEDLLKALPLDTRLRDLLKLECCLAGKLSVSPALSAGEGSKVSRNSMIVEGHAPKADVELKVIHAEASQYASL